VGSVELLEEHPNNIKNKTKVRVIVSIMFLIWSLLTEPRLIFFPINETHSNN
jgi:hypothetical protein